MLITKYRASLWPDDAPIAEVPVVRQTSTSVFLMNGKREYKQSHHVSYFDTMGQARQYLIDARTKQMNLAEKCLEDARAALHEAVVAMPPGRGNTHASHHA